MMTSLFSAFDPSTSTQLSMNWLSSMLMLTLLPMPFWIMPSRYSIIFISIMHKMHTEFKTTLGKNNSSTTILIISLFTFIMFNNTMGLMPYVFTSSSHMLFSLSMAMPLWITIMMFGWFNHTKNMLAHTIPSGTPGLLMPFMVCVETISNTIRPGSLAIRLMANMIAGHLFMSLLGNSTSNMNELLLPITMTIHLSLMMFEIAVAMIQAYVFSTLSTLYTKEVTYVKKT